MLDAKGVSFRYGSKIVLSDITLQFKTGANLILGRNGAGKTTLMRILAGAVAPTSGEVRLNGDLTGAATRSRRPVLRNIGWLPQHFGYPPRMSVSEFVAYAAWLKEVPADVIPKRVDKALAVVNLKNHASQPLGSLSGGQLRRAGLGSALAADPAVLILDEPTAGLDPEQREAFHDLVRQVRSEKIVIIATHLLEDVEALAGDIVIVDHGSVRWSGSLRHLSQMAGNDQTLTSLRSGFQKVVRKSQ